MSNMWICILIFYQLLSTDSIQINFYLTDLACHQNQPTRHYCLQVLAKAGSPQALREIVPYCLTECQDESTSNLTRTEYSSFTFQQLGQQNITSQQLYSWSASIDLIEKYEHFLEQLHHPFPTDIENELFYNCTWPRFGPSCQFTFDHLEPSSSLDSFSSLITLVNDYYDQNPYKPTTLTCYALLKCNRSPAPLCLDWSEICDGKIDCQDGGQDEEHCWQLEMNECEEDEFRCLNGQCVHRRFYFDGINSIECIDSSDETSAKDTTFSSCIRREPIVVCQDVSCANYRVLGADAWTNRCDRSKQALFARTLFSVRPAHLSDDCWLALICRISSELSTTSLCDDFCIPWQCGSIIKQYCPHNQSLYFLPSLPVLFGHLHLLYSIDQLTGLHLNAPLDFICLDSHFCNFLPLDNTTLRIDHMICHSAKSITFVDHPFISFDWYRKYPQQVYEKYAPCAALPDPYFHFCDDQRYHSHLYRCINTSKCVSRHRLLDRVNDCFYGDDEQMDIVGQLIDLANNSAFFRCPTSNAFISSRLVGDGECNCPPFDVFVCDDEYSEKKYVQTHISFQTTCDGFTDLKPVMVDGRLMTDETDCQHWLCDNLYTTCDKIWNCLDGRDEINCNRPLLSSSCSSDSRSCVLRNTSEVICLPIEKVNDGHVDCLGATDEPLICRQLVNNEYFQRDLFFCLDNSTNLCIFTEMLCQEPPMCKLGDDHQFCRRDQNGDVISFDCLSTDRSKLTPAEELFCHRFQTDDKLSIVHFSIISKTLVPRRLPGTQTGESLPSLKTTYTASSKENRCHRGLNLRLWLNTSSSSSDTSSIACLCPPSFYGSHCQFQNQRISLTLQFRALSDAWQTTFVMVALLIDHTHQRHIHSTHQLTYLPFRDCEIKFNFYLLFTTRPKNASFNYSVHFDIYEHHSHQHRASYLAPIIFPFLPVYRLALQLEIPRPQTQQPCRDLDCGKHGRCVRYARVFQALSPSTKSFCQCDNGWSGRLCTIPITCSCSLQARCLGRMVYSDRSICLCPSGTFGPRCYLSNKHICQGEDSQPKCLNGGQCIPSDEYRQQEQQPFTCVCPQGFTGDRCEQPLMQHIISFDSNLVNHLSQSMLIHFIRFYPDRRHENMTTVKSIPFNFAPVSILWSHPFHLVFIEFHRHQYYLAFVRPVFNQSEMVRQTMIRSSDRCPHIRELLSPTLANSHLLYRIKFYHSLCQSNNTMQQISCFYDEVHLCLCQLSPRNGDKREANCLEYNHEQKFDCLGHNACENDGQCFQDNPTCPQTSVCRCTECSYGRRCQFKMDGFRLSLDAILGYHIQPGVSLRKQPAIVLLAVGLVTIMICTGIINGVLSLLTFINKKLCEVGCVLYLLASSVTTLLTILVLQLKFFILLTTQMGVLTNRSFLMFQCRSLDFLLRICLNLDQWLNACVSLERAISSTQGVKFSKGKSKKMAKKIIVILVVSLVGSTSYEPMYRRLIDDKMNSHDEDNRIWCVAAYPKLLLTIDVVIHMFHFCVPFGINIISAVVIIWQSARSYKRTRTTLSFWVVFGQQFRQHKHILVAPIAIVVLSIPRLILAVSSGCMKSNSQSQIYLAGYLISFAPALLSFVIFVLPSSLYQNEFRLSLQRYRNMVRSLFGYVLHLVTLKH